MQETSQVGEEKVQGISMNVLVGYRRSVYNLPIPGLCGLTTKGILFAGLTHESGGLGRYCGCQQDSKEGNNFH